MKYEYQGWYSDKSSNVAGDFLCDEIALARYSMCLTRKGIQIQDLNLLNILPDPHDLESWLETLKRLPANPIYLRGITSRSHE